jgi:hypothetical protein
METTRNVQKMAMASLLLKRRPSSATNLPKIHRLFESGVTILALSGNKEIFA